LEIGGHPDPLGAIQIELDTLWSTHPHVPDDVRMRGRGLALANTVLDQLAHRCDDLGNQWTLISQRFA
jgi:anti-sigma regulatory factor (Ser/Thr protein kinase)